MGVSAKITGDDLSKLVTVNVRSMTQLGELAVFTINDRVGKGKATTGNAFKRYSTSPITVSKNSGTGLRLAPKGGRPSASGDSVYYANGYRQYKRQSRKGGIRGAEVDLTLSGAMLRRLGITEKTKTTVAVNVSGESATYAPAVDSVRPFISVSKRELDNWNQQLLAIFVSGGQRPRGPRRGSS